MLVSTRLVAPEDVPALVGLLRANREFLAPWEPARTDDYFTNAYHDAAVRRVLAQYQTGDAVPHVIVGDGAVLGRITLTNVVYGSFQSANLGYWVASTANGRGVATAAVAALLRVAFVECGLHRVEAATLLHNIGSQRVLERNGFTRIGIAPRYLQIAGKYQDHILYQRLVDEKA
jgi:[ribosomal protein S5]-alanine N-acetyltransferase